MKEQKTLIENKTHDQEDEAKEPFDGRSYIGCIFLTLAIIVGFIFFARWLIHLIR